MLKFTFQVTTIIANPVETEIMKYPRHLHKIECVLPKGADVKLAWMYVVSETGKLSEAVERVDLLKTEVVK